MITKMKSYFLILTVFTGLLGSCDSDSESVPQGTGTLVVRMTDAPFPYEMVAEANVTVFKIDARLKDGEIPEEGMEGEPGDPVEAGSPYIVLMEEEIPLNLLELTNGITAKLAELEVPAGSYDLVRIYVKGVNVVLKDGTTYDLKVPSGEQTGIKVFINPELVVAGGLSTDLLLDFDVSRSFVAKGSLNSPQGINGFNYKPVIKATNNSIAGTLSGRVTTLLEDETVLGLEGAEVSVYAADTLNTTTFTDADGGYAVLGLLAGTYEVDVNLEGYEPAFAEDVNIIAANRTTLDFELTALEEPVEEPGAAIRINAGGPAFSFDGLDWAADDYFGGGSTFSNPVAIANTTNTELYQTARYADNGTLIYEIPVTDGAYNVNLHFAEIFYGLPGDGSGGGEGSRVFDIDIENGQEQLNGYDITVAAGGAATAVVESFTGVAVSDGSLTITLTSVEDNAKIAGIEVLQP